MEEPEVPLEQVSEDLHHKAMHSGERWITWVALTSALLAAIAAVSSMLSGHYANVAVIAQIQSANHWSHYQAKSIKLHLLTTKTELVNAAGVEPNRTAAAKDAEYRSQLQQISTEAEDKEQQAEHALETHEVFARAVTLFQVAIAVAAISALTKRKAFWLTGLVFGGIGVGFFVQGLVILAGA